MNQNNYCVIMAGGVGSRFWPFSRNEQPKQFLDFFGTGRSLLQMTIDRFRPIVPIENILIVTNVIYRDQVLAQIPDLKAEQVLCEPARRNTAPCIAYAVARIKALEAQKGHTEGKAKIVVAPSDHLILQEETFRQTIQKGFDFIENHDALLTLGMKPTRPETGYGYIQMGEKAEEDICRVKAFTEKPNLELAKVFLDSGDFLWNSGIFLWSLASINEAFNAYLPDIATKFAEGEGIMGTADEDAFIQQMFPTCPSISIDYGVMEKAKNVHVIPSDFGWSDLGTWGSLRENVARDNNGNAIIGDNVQIYETRGCVVHCTEERKVIIQGLEDCIVAEKDDTLLICKLSEEQRIKLFSEK